MLEADEKLAGEEEKWDQFSSGREDNDNSAKSPNCKMESDYKDGGAAKFKAYTYLFKRV